MQGCWKLEMHQNDLKHLTVKYPVYTEYPPMRPKLHSISFYDKTFRDTSLSKIGNAPNDFYHITFKSSMYTLNSHLKTKFHSVSLYDQEFSRYKLLGNRKCTEWHQNDLHHLTVKSKYSIYIECLALRPKFHSVWLYCEKFPVYTEYAPPRPKFIQLLSTTSNFRDTFLSKLSKIGNAMNDTTMTLSILLSKVVFIHWIFTPAVQTSLRFALWPVIFEIQASKNRKII